MQRVGAWALEWVLGVTGTGDISPLPDTGASSVTTDWPLAQHVAIQALAASHAATVPEFQKSGALFVAYVLSIAG